LEVFISQKHFFADTYTLSTIPATELAAGLAECIRYVVIKDKNLRALLNYRHTIGHAIEIVTDYKQFRRD